MNYEFNYFFYKVTNFHFSDTDCLKAKGTTASLSKLDI